MLFIEQGELGGTESPLLGLGGLWLWWVPALTSLVCEGLSGT